MIRPLICKLDIIDETLAEVWRGGAKNCEALVLWLGQRSGDVTKVVEAYVPDYEARRDQFHVRPDSMRAIMTHLRTTRTHICAQVHSHPGQAFHSHVDDEWAIVRHQGAISLVVPNFGSGLGTAGFLDVVAAFALSATDRWEQILPDTLPAIVRIQDADA